MIASVPRCFESMLEREPDAPAVVLVRPGGRDRVWVRAAVEHRAVRIAGVCARVGLAPHASVAIACQGALDRLAAAWFVLATGRILVLAGEADFTIDDELCRQSEIRTEPYSIRCVVQPTDPAALLPAPVPHNELLRLVFSNALPAESPLVQAVHALATGRPLEIVADGHGNDGLRARVYAA